MSLRRLLVLLCVVALAGAGLSACGSSASGDSAGGSGGAQDLLRQTFGPDRPIRSGRLDLAVRVDAKGLAGLSGPVALKLAGPFQTQGKGKVPELDLTLGLSMAGQSLTAGIVSTQGKGFLRFQGRSYAVGDDLFRRFTKGFQQANGAQASSGASLAALGIAPLQWLQDPQVAGDETVAGVLTTKVSAKIAVGRLLDDVDRLLGKARGATGAAGAQVPAKIPAATKKAIQDAVKTATVDIWTGKQDKTLRRAAVRIAFDVPQDQRAQAGGLSTGTIALDLTLADLNKPQAITAPAGAKPLSGLLGQLKGLLGAAGLGSASKYKACLDAAGQDLGKVQRCAALLGR